MGDANGVRERIIQNESCKTNHVKRIMQNESCKTNHLKRISKMNNAKQSKILPKGDIFSFYGRLK